MKKLDCLLQTMLLVLFVVSSAGAQMRVPVSPAKDELYRVDTPEAILKAARALMQSDENMALVTVDNEGQPRVRTVRAFLTDVDPLDVRRGMTVWVMTRDTTRKIKQIRKRPQVTLYFNDDAKVSYLTIMGTAVVHTDPNNPRVKPFVLDGYKEFFWPQFPKGFVMLEIIPRWIEFMGPGIKNHKENWRPQSVEFPPK
jgi:general stress protein 26